MTSLLEMIGRRSRQADETERRALDARVHTLFDDVRKEDPPERASTVVPPAVPQQPSEPTRARVDERVVRDDRGRITAIRPPTDRAYDSIAERDRARNEVMGLASHELRTPLTSIKGYAALLMDGEAGEMSVDQREMVAVIRKNTDRLVALLDDVVNLARIPSAAA